MSETTACKSCDHEPHTEKCDAQISTLRGVSTCDCNEWTCPKPGCELGVGGHDFGLAIAHCMDMDEQEASNAADRILTRVERHLLGEDS